MPLHHYLPASFIARFSADMRKIPARKKHVVVGDKKEQKCFQAPAERVGCVNNLYTLADERISPETIDQTWADYEKNLPAALDSLINQTVDAETWLRVLVPFVACMLVRSPDFHERFGNRFPAYLHEKLSGLFDADHANRARLRELQLLLTAVLAAKWLVLKAHGKGKILTNDLGYAPFVHIQSGERGLAIPLNHRTILAIIPRAENTTILYEKDNNWVPDIQTLDLPPGNQVGLNQALAQTALRFTFGPDFPTVQKYIRGVPENPIAPEPDMLGFPDTVFLRAFEFTWHRLVGATKKPPSDRSVWDFQLDWDAVTSGWYSMPFTPVNLVEFPPALERVENTINLNFYDPTIYYDISKILFLEDIKDYEKAIEVATNSLTHDLDSALKLSMLVKRATLHLKLGNFTQMRVDRDAAVALASDQVAKGKILKELKVSLQTLIQIFWDKIISAYKSKGSRNDELE
jgi:hypothetical protein